jgi:hypothetical protein
LFYEKPADFVQELAIVAIVTGPPADGSRAELSFDAEARGGFEACDNMGGNGTGETEPALLENGILAK